ncbi:MAG: VCBS repeat-containing protein, partial [Chloroflexi bacterium]|nr:VCBS repeat-containing protein [Chloroflexota bacterium]
MLLGNGMGGFEGKTFATGLWPLSMTAADFNGDGKIDLATANRDSHTVSVLLGDGLGGFGAKTDFATGSYISSVTAADFNGDGKIDLATANTGSNTVSVLINRGERVVVNGADLVVAEVLVEPGQASVGEPLQVKYRVENRGPGVAQSRWVDSIYLSRDQQFDATDRLLGRVIHDGDVAVGGHYSQTVDVAVPLFAGFTPGSWFVLVRADAAADVAETNNTNNTATASVDLALPVIPLALDVAATGVIVSGEDVFYQVEALEGQPLSFVLDDLPPGSTVGMYVKYGGLPSRSVFDRAGVKAFASEQYVYLPAAWGGTYYVMIHAATVASSPASYRLTASVPDFGVRSTLFGTGGTAGDYTIQVVGAGFDRTITARLSDGQGFDLPAKAHWYESETQLYATFDLRGVTPGSYSVVFARGDGAEVTVPQSLTIIQTTNGPDLQVALLTPSALRVRSQGVMYVELTNNGSNDSLVPVVWLRPPTGMAIGADPSNLSEVDELLLDIQPDDLPLPFIVPGRTVLVPVYYRAPLTSGNVSITAQIYNANLRESEPVREAGIGSSSITDPYLLSWDDDDYSYQLSALGNGPSFISSARTWFRTPVESSFPSTSWDFQYSAAVPGAPSPGNTTFEVYYDSARAGAEFTIGQSAPWIQVVDTAPLTSPEHVDPVPDGTGYDNLPFYWSVAEAGNSSTSDTFSDSPSVSLPTLRTLAASASDRTFEVTFTAETHAAEWMPPLDASPAVESVLVDEDGVVWGYRIRVEAKEPEEILGSISVVTSWDPNDIIGPAGVGALNHVDGADVMPYTIHFENAAGLATAPAAMVSITQTLDPDLDWTTFRLGDFGFGNTVIDVPTDSAFFQTRLDLTATRGVYLDVTAGINAATGEVRWEFTAIDPATGDLPEDPLVGFLPPNVNGPEGEGFVTYTVQPKSSAKTGDRIDAQASIVFDVNDPIITPAIFNTLDGGAPGSTVLPLPATESTLSFPITWSGADDAGGSGIATYDIFVSDNGGAYALWKDNTPDASATFTGTPGHNYAFYSRATDGVGHQEEAPAVADTATYVNTPPTVDAGEPTGSALEGTV